MAPNLTAAQGYFDLGMFEDAWAATEALPPIDSTDPRTLELRLRVLTALERWELGGHIAGVLICSDVEREKCRETVARFHHGNARALSLAGVEGSRRQIRAAVDAWPVLWRHLFQLVPGVLVHSKLVVAESGGEVFVLKGLPVFESNTKVHRGYQLLF